MAEAFRPLENLRKVVDGARMDLKKLRSLNTTTQQKVAAASNRPEFTSEFRMAEVSKIREAARAEATKYIDQQDTFRLLESVSNQAPRWTIAAFLSRAPAVPSPDLDPFKNDANTVALLKAQVALTRIQNALLAVRRMTSEALSEMVMTDLEHGNWQSLGVAYTELCFRGENDASARALKMRVDTADIPQVKEARALIEEADQLADWLKSTLRAISAGDDDIGVRTEGYAAQWKAMQESRRSA